MLQANPVHFETLAARFMDLVESQSWPFAFTDTLGNKLLEIQRAAIGNSSIRIRAVLVPREALPAGLIHLDH